MLKRLRDAAHRSPTAELLIILGWLFALLVLLSMGGLDWLFECEWFNR